MRKSFIIAAVLVAALTSCQKEVEGIREAAGGNVVWATREAPQDETKASINDENAVAWAVKDSIAIYDGSSSWNKYYAVTVDGTKAEFYGEGERAGYAVFPCIKDNLPSLGEDGALSVSYPSSYTWAEGQTNVPMLATFEKGASKMNFKHLGGLVKVTVKQVPAVKGELVFWADKAIAGSFEVADGQVSAAEAAAKTPVTISFDNSKNTEKQDMDFYVPVPVGTYKFSMQLNVTEASVTIKKVSGTKDNEIKRCTYLVMPALTLSSIDSETGDGALTADVTVDKTYTAATTVALPATTADVNVYFNADQAQAITLAYNNTLDGDKPANVYVYAGENDIKTLNITLAESTVTLVTGTYGTVSASTAENTLVVNEDVKIDTKLTVTKGNLEFYGKTNSSNNATVEINNAASSVKVGAFDDGNGYIHALTLTAAKSAEIYGKVGTLTCGASSQVVTVKTTGAVVNTLTRNSAIVYVEKKSDTEAGSVPGGLSAGDGYKIINLAGLQQRIYDALNNGEIKLTAANGGYSIGADEQFIVSGKKVTIDLGGQTVEGKFVVESGATLVLKGTGASKLNAVGGNAIIDNSGTVELEGNVEYTGDIVNGGKLTIKAGTLEGDITSTGDLTITTGTITGDIVNKDDLTIAAVTLDGTIDNRSAKTFTVAEGVILPEVIEADGTSTTYVTSDADFTAAIKALNDDEAKSWKFSKIVVNENDGITASTSAPYSIGAAASASRKLEIELRGDITAANGKDAFSIVNADVTFSVAQVKADGTASSDPVTKTIAGGEKSALVLTGEAAASATKEAYTSVSLGAGVVLTGTAAAISVAANNSGVVVESVADMSAAGILVDAKGTATADLGYAPVINLNGGKLKYITANGYAVWNLKGVAVTNSGATAVALGKGVMNVYSVKSGDDETTKVTATGQTAFAVKGGTLNIEGGEISAETGIDLSTGEVEVKGGSISAATAAKLTKGTMTVSGEKTTISGTTASFDVDGANTAVTLSISDATVSGKFDMAVSGATAVKDFIQSGTFDDLAAMYYGADSKTVNITLGAEASGTSYTVAKGKKVNLDLNGYKVTSASANTFTVDYGGSLAISDSNASKGGNAEVANTESNAICILNNGEVTLKGGKYGKIVNHGEMTFGESGAETVDVTVESAASGSVILNGYADYASEYTAPNATATVSSATPKLTIYGGTFTGKSSSATEVVKNAAGGELYIQGGTFENENSGQYCIVNLNEATITKGSFIAASGTAVKSGAAYTTTAYTETVKSEGQKGEMTISGESSLFNGALAGPVADTEYGKLEIKGGQYSVDPAKYVDTDTYKIEQVYAATGTNYIVSAK